MSDLSAMSPTARSSVQHVAAALDPSGAVVPSLLRHLAQSPEALQAVERVVDHANELGELGRRSLVMQRRVEEAAAAWPTSVRPVTEDGARTVLLRFGAVIPRMLALSSLLRESLDH